MRIRHTILTVAPSLAVLGLIWALWEGIEAFAIYTPIYTHQWLVGIALLALLPLGFQLVRWGATRGRKIPHPFGVVVPFGLLLVLPLWSAGEKIASWCPALCEVSTSLKVKPKRPGKFGPSASFSAGTSGQGNPSSYQFSLVTLIYTMYPSERRKDDLYVLIPRWEGFYINSYPTYFPVTRDTILEYVEGSDDFPEGEAVQIADELWAMLNDLAVQRNMPPLVYRGWDHPGPRIVYWVPSRNIYLATAALCIPVLLVVSWLLAGWYTRYIQPERDTRPQNPCTRVAEAGPAESEVVPDRGGIT